ncbi:MAG: ArnT family glycosyltransferase, partial [Phycisphaeraceae bacterium]
GVALGSIFVYGSAKRMLGLRGAPWAMVIFGTSLMPLWLATAATADGVTVAWLAMAQWLFIEMIYRGWRGWHMVLMALALGLTALGKGPMAVLPVISIALSAVLLRRMDPDPPKLGPKFWAAGVVATLAGLGLFLAWAIPANLATEGALAQEGLFNRGFITRMFKPMQGHGGEGILGYLLTLPIYLPYLVFDTFPWCLLLPGAFAALVRGRLAGPRERALLWAWTLPTFVIFSLVATKLPHYMLGLMPMLAIGLASVPARYRAPSPAKQPTSRRAAEGMPGPRMLNAKDRDWVRGGAWFFGGIAVALAGGLLVGPWLVRLDEQRPVGLIAAGAVVGVAVLVVTVWVVRLHLKERVLRSCRATLLGFVVIVVLSALVLMPRIEETIKISPELASDVKTEVPADAPVYMSGYEEPSLVFYLDRDHDQPVRSLNDGQGTLDAFAATPGPAALVVSRENWLRLLGGEPMPDRLEQVAVARTLNYSARARREDVLVIVRRPRDASEASEASESSDASEASPAAGRLDHAGEPGREP